MAHVAKHKIGTVSELEKLFTSNPIIGTVDMENMPTPQLQIMRAQLRGKVQIKVAKRRLIKIAIENCKDKVKGLDQLNRKLRGMPGVIATSENPFRIFRTIQASKSPAPAKAGQTAPRDITVKAGPTPFMPGPIIGELGSLGIQTGIENGKVAIKADKIVVKEGEEISANVAGLLSRLGIQPMEIGLNIVTMLEDGVTYDAKVLNVDEKEYLDNIGQAARWALNLAVESGFPTAETVQILIMKAAQESRNLSVSEGIPTQMTIGLLLGRAEAEAAGLKGTVGQ